MLEGVWKHFALGMEEAKLAARIGPRVEGDLSAFDGW